MSEVRNMTAEGGGVVRAGEGALPHAVRRFGIYAAVALVIFLAGLVPMWLRANTVASQRDAARRELQLSRMQNMLASAAVDAERGEYEPARQEASDFFTALRERLDDGGAEETLSAAQREGLKPLLIGRDDVITLLARNDPAAGPRRLEMYAAFRRAINGAPPETKAAR
ncbi:MAG TPA: hypothetical protein VD861_04360 [Pyrinomonadaceae bacterium]|nr:hypothetical protein [Pyrinomonadaceae bacterium]